MLLVPACYELIRDILKNGKAHGGAARRVLQFLALFLIPAGFFAYCMVCKSVSGNPFQWMIYQREHWHQQLGFFFHTAAYQTQNAIRTAGERDMPLFMGLWLPNLICSFGALGIFDASVRRLRPSYGAYFLAYFFIAIGATWLLSAPRYLLTLFPIPLGLAALTKNRHADAVFTVILTVFSVLYSIAFVFRWQVW